MRVSSPSTTEIPAATIFACDDASELFVLTSAARGPAHGRVLIIPPYGKNCHELVLLSHFLSVNGFEVVRFDARHAVGRSTGTILNYTLGQVEKDVLEVLDRGPRDRLPLILVGVSLSSPVAWRVAALRSTDVSGVISLVGVVDVTATVERLLPEKSLDVFRKPGTPEDVCTEIFGYRVRPVPFVRDMDQGYYLSLGSTSAAMRQMRCPAHMVMASLDEYVPFDEAGQVMTALPAGSRQYILEGASHELSRSIVAAKAGARAVGDFACQIAGVSRAVVSPSLAEIVRASAMESEYLSGLATAAGAMH